MPIISRLLYFFNRSLRTKVTLGVVLPLVLILGIFTTIEYHRLREVMLGQLSLLASFSGQLIEDNLRHEMVESDTDGIQVILDTIKESGNFRLADQRPRSVIVTTSDNQRVFRSMTPIENSAECATCHDKDAQLLGVLLADISIVPFEEQLASDLSEELRWWVGAILITILVINYAINRFVLRRLEGVVEAIADFGNSESPQQLFDDQPDEIGRLVGTFNTMAGRVERRSQENRALSENLRIQSERKADLLNRLITIQEDERIRIARELHDGLGQSLAGLALQTEAMVRLIASDQNNVIKQLDQIKTLINETTNDMYDLILDLRPSSLDDLGLVPAFRSYADRVLNNTDIELEFNVLNFSERLPPDIETTLFRTFQEALINVVRHANATKVEISFFRNNDFFEGEITDNGQGFDIEDFDIYKNDPRGLGLLGMKERVQHCDGKLEILSTPGKGTKIHIRIPLSEVSFGR
jgi:signal transduction histidine kinase